MNKRGLFYSLPLILLLTVAVAGWFAQDYLGNKARQEIIGESQAAVLALSTYVSSTFTNIEGSVKALAGSPWIAPALMTKRERDVEQANTVLDRYNSALNASVSYLMDADGLTVASSNRTDPDSFVGKSYSFRPYFQDAAKGHPSRYFALGITSGKRGFYASYPVRNRPGKVIGVVTMKKDLDDMGTFFRKYPLCFLLSPEGIIFLSSKPAMVLKSLWPLGKTAREKLISSQQFGNRLFETNLFKKEITDGAEVTLEGDDYFVSRKVIDSDGWSILLLTQTDRIGNYKLIGILATISTSFLIMVFLGIIYVTDRSKEAIRQSEEGRRLLLHAAGEGILGVDATGRVTFINPAALHMLGFSEEEMIGQSVHNLIHHSHKDGSDYPAEDCPMYASYTKAAENHVTDEILWRKDGSSFPVEYSSMPITKDGRVVGAVVNFKDISARRRAEEALSDSENRLHTLVRTIPDLIWLKDKDGIYLSCNTTFERFFGAREADIIGKTDYNFIDRELSDSFREHDRKAMAAGKPTSQEDWITFADDGHRAFVETIKTPMYDARERLIGVLGIGRDITERKRSEEKLEFFAAHDVLTGLLNRRSLEEMLNRTIAKAKRGTFSSLLYMDLDNFKDVNDTVGHASGDDVLITLAGLFKDAVRTEDVVFRLGGDEFAFLLDGIDGREALFVSERMRSAVEAHRFEFEGRVFPLSLSIGLIEIDGTLVTGELMSKADAAMYRAKELGKNRVVMA